MWPFAAALRAAAATFLHRVANHHLLFHVSNVFLFGQRLWNQEIWKTGRKWAKMCISADFRVRGCELDVRARERLRARETEIRARGSLHAFSIQFPGTIPPPRTVLFAPANSSRPRTLRSRPRIGLRPISAIFLGFPTFLPF